MASALSNTPIVTKSQASSQAPSSNEGEKMITQNQQRALEIFSQASNNFDKIYQMLPADRKDLSSLQFSQLVQQAENALEEAEKVSAENPSEELKNKALAMRMQFKELYSRIPLGKSIFLKEDERKLKQLFIVPENETYESKWGVFYEPKVSTMIIDTYLEGFRAKHHYISISLSQKKDNFHRECREIMMTIIGFRKEKKDNSFLSSLLTKKENINMQTTELSNLLSLKIQEWGFQGFEVGHESLREETLKLKGVDVQEWGCYAILYHKKVEELPESIQKIPASPMNPIEPPQKKDLDNEKRNGVGVDEVKSAAEIRIDDVKKKKIKKKRNPPLNYKGKKSQSLPKFFFKNYIKPIFIFINNALTNLRKIFIRKA